MTIKIKHKVMNSQDQKMLDDILAKNRSSITSEDIEVLRARRDYLTQAQKEEYGLEEKEEDIPGKPSEGDETGNSKDEDENPGEDETTPEDGEGGSGEETDLEEVKEGLKKMTVKELQDLCKESGIEYTGNKAQLIARIIKQSS